MGRAPWLGWHERAEQWCGAHLVWRDVAQLRGRHGWGACGLLPWLFLPQTPRVKQREARGTEEKGWHSLGSYTSGVQDSHWLWAGKHQNQESLLRRQGLLLTLDLHAGCAVGATSTLGPFPPISSWFLPQLPSGASSTLPAPKHAQVRSVGHIRANTLCVCGGGWAGSV